MLTAVFSVPIFVIPSSMLTWGFEAEAERLMRRKRESRKKSKLAKQCGTKMESSSSSEEEKVFESEDEESAWDEYERVVLGDDNGDDDKAGNEMSKEDKKLFRMSATTLPKPMWTRTEPYRCSSFLNSPACNEEETFLLL